MVGFGSAFADGPIPFDEDSITLYDEFAEPLGEIIDWSQIKPGSLAGGVAVNDYGLFPATLGDDREVWLDRSEFNFEVDGVDCDEADVASAEITRETTATAGVMGAGGSCN